MDKHYRGGVRPPVVSIWPVAFNGTPPDEVLAAPMDILQRSGLAQTLGMMRMQGLSAMYRRIKQEVLQGVVRV